MRPPTSPPSGKRPTPRSTSDPASFARRCSPCAARPHRRPRDPKDASGRGGFEPCGMPVRHRHPGGADHRACGSGTPSLRSRDRVPLQRPFKTIPSGGKPDPHSRQAPHHHMPGTGHIHRARGHRTRRLDSARSSNTSLTPAPGRRFTVQPPAIFELKWARNSLTGGGGWLTPSSTRVPCVPRAGPKGPAYAFDRLPRMFLKDVGGSFTARHHSRSQRPSGRP